MGLFGNIFDFNGDGEASCFEEALGLTILDDLLEEEEEDDKDDDEDF